MYALVQRLFWSFVSSKPKMAGPSDVIVIVSSDEEDADADADVEDFAKCAICFQLMCHPVSISECGHKFCMSCICEAMRIRRSCPCCRADIGATSFGIDIFVRDAIIARYPKAYERRRKEAQAQATALRGGPEESGDEEFNHEYDGLSATVLSWSASEVSDNLAALFDICDDLRGPEREVVEDNICHLRKRLSFLERKIDELRAGS